MAAVNQRSRVVIGMDAIHQLRRTLRSFGRQPGLTAIIVGTLALGVGLNSAVFAVAYTAVGASPARLVRLVAAGSLVMTTAGILAGLASAAAMGRGLASLLYGVSPYDPLTFSGVALLVLGGAVAATLVPARRAARLDPVIALRGD